MNKDAGWHMAGGMHNFDRQGAEAESLAIPYHLQMGLPNWPTRSTKSWTLLSQLALIEISILLRS
ncbi:MAG: hypothetical protein L0219_11415 [Phycisphaerales bacterium]|nr:hypothetical protein [Phycisphaerales bacterium]